MYIILCTSCRGDEIIYPTLGDKVTNEVRSGGLYLLCEGNMGSNKARLDYINLHTGDYYSNWYGGQNPNQLKELGDVGNDLQQYGHRLYAVINCSHKVEVMDLQARHIGQINIPNCRYMAFHGDKMYVSAYVGSIADPNLLGSVYEVDTTTLQITREVKVGHQPDEICLVNEKLYVCNSGGYLLNQYDSTISVVDIHSMTETKQIPVGLNPTRIRMDNAGKLWVCCQGDNNNQHAQIVVLQNEQIVHRIPIPCSNLSILDNTAYIIDKNNKQLLTISTIDYTINNTPISLDAYENPYALLATPGALYITDAKNYVSSGLLHCYSYDGTERWTAKTGDIPGHLCRVAGEYTLHGDTHPIDTTTTSPYIHRVYEYKPAMGQFVNTMPKYEVGDDEQSMCRKCELSLAHNAGGTVTLGGWGGYIVFGFDHPVRNKDGKDIQIRGNAFRMSGNSEYGGSEPGIVMVSVDENTNGLPDDTWYELKGSMYSHPSTIHHHTYTYTRAQDTIRNPFHTQPYYPQWIEEDSITFHGALLAPITTQINGQYVQRLLEWGYADNQPNTDIEATSFDLSWAVDTNGQSVQLTQIDFVRVYTAVQETYTQTGELSTEITGAVDLHAQ
ncbi:MAG: hypothetical protein UHJ11_01320 [Paludibacteraceae bacterium]|nr:hypothetical protein [Paludibacteraceae bacterium]